MKALVFGAGNIGRGFLAERLCKSGFDVTFVDVDEGKVILINERREYPVLSVSAEVMVESLVTRVSALSLTDRESVIAAVVSADIIMTAVGKHALSAVADCLAEGLVHRLRLRPNAEAHVVVVACENVQDNSTYLRTLVLARVPEEQREEICDRLSFPNCVVDRIVPNSVPEYVEGDPLAVAVEEYFQLAIDEEGLRAQAPAIEGMTVVDNLPALIEQKLFTLNMAHALVGYFGYLRGYDYVHEAIDDEDIRQLLDGALAEVARLLHLRHPSIGLVETTYYAHAMIKRFKNPHLRDDIKRVARQPIRKLGPADRLVRPAVLAEEEGIVPTFLSSGIAAALHYDHQDDTEAVQLVACVRTDGIERVIHQVTGLGRESELARVIQSHYFLRSL